MILVTGATGKIGVEVVRLLGEAGAPARALLRSPEKAKGWQGIEVVEGDLDDAASVVAALRGVTRVLLLTAAGNAAQELRVIEAAKQAGVEHVVKISSMGASAEGLSRLARGHAESEAALKRSGLGWTILRPGFFAQNLLAFVPAIKARGRFSASVREGKIAPIDARDIAAVAVKALLEPGHRGKIYTLTGPVALSYAELAAKLAAAIGRPVAYVDLPPSETREALVHAGMPGWLADDMLALQARIASGDASTVVGDVAAVLGRAPRSFDDFARDHAAVFG
jgi:uncharacterized protein YbjT (DUF2867 family)